MHVKARQIKALVSTHGVKAVRGTAVLNISEPHLITNAPFSSLSRLAGTMQTYIYTNKQSIFSVFGREAPFIQPTSLHKSIHLIPTLLTVRLLLRVGQATHLQKQLE